MSSHDFADRTLPPTERRRREAKARGEVARSAELTAAAALLAASCLLWSIGPATVNTFATLMRKTLASQPPTEFDVHIATNGLQAAIGAAATVIWPFLLVLALCTITANLIQTGWLWAPTAIQPRFRYGSILTWGRLVESVTRLTKLGVLAFVTWNFFAANIGNYRSISMDEPMTMLAVSATKLGELCLRLSLCLVAIALVDFGIKFWHHEQRLKMTAEERRREQREEEIDPRIKRRRITALERTAN